MGRSGESLLPGAATTAARIPIIPAAPKSIGANTGGPSEHVESEANQTVYHGDGGHRPQNPACPRSLAKPTRAAPARAPLHPTGGYITSWL